MVDEVVTPKPVEEESELKKLMKRLDEMDNKATPVIVAGYLKFKAFLNKHINKYPVPSAWISAVFGAFLMYWARRWFQF